MHPFGYYFYGSTWQRVYDEISDLAEQEHLRVVFTKEFQVSDLEKSITPEFRPALVIVDDLEEELVDNKQFRQMANKDSHHLDLSVVITFESIFPGGQTERQRPTPIRLLCIFHLSSIIQCCGQIWPIME